MLHVLSFQTIPDSNYFFKLKFLILIFYNFTLSIDYKLILFGGNALVLRVKVDPKIVFARQGYFFSIEISLDDQRQNKSQCGRLQTGNPWNLPRPGVKTFFKEFCSDSISVVIVSTLNAPRNYSKPFSFLMNYFC